ncbi:MAG: Energy-dependent translational throttle protein EttA [Chlamydiia bacterium]|nr:Energy-dependent translational throttle protein EttA [Chlamydiia bacterium]MCH9615247.1 Energy-dependent translational throttle protein EttA [Chlamydiia bacterium]MCH9628431.1 Energy-dependent translational throttle protein EttA [Chlamydiia bacterium]
MLLLNTKDLTKSYGTRKLFKDLSVSVFEGDKIGLIGQNGSGKSTFLKILAKDEVPSSGEVVKRGGLKIGYLPQTCEMEDISPLNYLLESLKDDHETPDYEKQRHAETWLTKLGFKGDETSSKILSGGWKKRLRLAREMLLNPDVLLLDEPTNHLDLEGILFLETFLKREVTTYVLVSHDRYFLSHATSRIIEIDPSYPEGVFNVDGPYTQFLEKKEQFLAGQLEQERSKAGEARREQEWLRTSPKARTTKSRSRIERANEAISDLADLKQRNKQQRAGINFSSSERETQKLITANNLSMELGNKTLFQGLNFVLSPGTRMGLMGPNGSGKTTLLRLLAGELSQTQGTLKSADGLNIVYFDQHRNKHPDNITLREALSPTGDFVNYQGQSIHVNGWCRRFLFAPEVLDMQLGRLSGGERARIAIAHLMLQKADLLLLDEPTNDLDIPTVETLESSLSTFPGAVVLITHDRCMLDRTCTTLLGLGHAKTPEIYSSFDQWQTAQKPKSQKEKKTKKTPPKDKKLLRQIERDIEKKETELKALTATLETTKDLEATCKQIALIETQIEELYLAWEHQT